MATCRDIIYRAYRMMGVVPNTDDPTADELETGLGVLQGIYDRVADARDYTPVVASGTYDANENERVTGATAVNLPTTVVDCVTGEDRAPKDTAFVQYDIGAGFVTHVSDRGSWVALDGLEAGDEAPFSKRNSEGLSALVALEMAESHPGAAIGPMTAQKARRFQTIFSRSDTIDPEYY